MDKKIFLMFGVVSIIVAYTLCLTHAANDYGIVKNSLSVSVLAQDTGSGGNGGSTTGEGGGTTGEGGSTTEEGGSTTEEGGSTTGDNGGTTSPPENKYDCDKRDCEVEYGFPPVVIVKKGYWWKCIDGNTVDKCSKCHIDCDALIK